MNNILTQNDGNNQLGIGTTQINILGITGNMIDITQNTTSFMSISNSSSSEKISVKKPTTLNNNLLTIKSTAKIDSAATNSLFYIDDNNELKTFGIGTTNEYLRMGYNRPAWGPKTFVESNVSGIGSIGYLEELKIDDDKLIGIGSTLGVKSHSSAIIQYDTNNDTSLIMSNGVGIGTLTFKTKYDTNFLDINLKEYTQNDFSTGESNKNITIVDNYTYKYTINDLVDNDIHYYKLSVNDLLSDATSTKTTHLITLRRDTTVPIINAITTSWGSKLNSTEDNDNGTFTVTTSGVENGQTLTIGLNGQTYTGTLNNNSVIISISASDLQGLTEGESYTITANVSDSAGNDATQFTSSFTVDTTSPTASITSHISTYTNDTTPNFTFTTNETGTLTTNISQGFSSNSTISSTGSHTITFNTLPEAEYSGKTITLTDAAGNTTTMNLNTFTVDTTAPTISIGAFSWGTKLEYGEDSSAGTVTVTTNRAENGQVITLGLNSNNYTATISGNSNPATDHNTIVTISAAGLQGLSTGNYTLTANVSDTAGNAATQTTATVEVDKTFSLSSWLDTSEQYKIFAVGSSGMTQKTSGGKKMTSNSNESNWSSNSLIGAGLLDSSTRSSHLNSNTATNKSGAGYGIQWVRGGPYWLAGSSTGLPYFSHDSYSTTPYKQGTHIPTPPNYSTRTTQYDGTNDYDSVFNLVKGSQSDAYKFETYAVRDGVYAPSGTTSKNILIGVSQYGGNMQTGSGHPYGDFNKIELSPQWKGGSPTGPSTLTVNTGGSDITYECVCVIIKGDYDSTQSAGANLADDSDMKNVFWVETSWGSGGRYFMYTGVDTAGHSGYGGGNYWQWINRYFGAGANSTTYGNSTTIATTEFWICKIP